MPNTDVSLSNEHLLDLLGHVRAGVQFDPAAYFILLVDLNQSHEDAFKFAIRFCLYNDGCEPKSFDELVLTNALLNYGVTVDEIIEFDETLRNIDYESEAIMKRNEYLVARCRRASHADLMRDASIPST
jgi:hypothetical protein